MLESRHAVQLFAHIRTASLIAMIVGCASPSDPLLNHVRVFQPGDNRLDCAALKNQIFSLDDDIEKLEKIVSSNDRSAPTSRTVNPNSPSSSVMLAIAAIADNFKSDEDAKYRRSLETRQQRRDVLMQQYFALQC